MTYFPRLNQVVAIQLEGLGVIVDGALVNDSLRSRSNVHTE
jgi:hypothetical protein